MKPLVLFSGGVDSTTCLALAIKHHGKENVTALSIYYGQKHSKELQAAKAIVKHYDIEHIEMDLTPIFQYSNCSLLQQSNEEIPLKTYKEQLQENEIVTTYVPFRNGLFLSVAASIALSKECNLIYYGAHKEDSNSEGGAYPDCSKTFDDTMSKAIYYGSGNKLNVITPFISNNKSEIVKFGIGLQVPYHLTWSCYKGEEKQCGKCGTCLDRKRAFAVNNILE